MILRRRPTRTGIVALSLLLTAPLMAACGAPAGTSAGVSVVATTDVYGDLVQQVAGKLAGHEVRITSIIDDPAADPHSYEGNARTQLAFARADLVVENGGGYDDFADRMHKAAANNAPLLNAYDIAHTGQDNEHVWYDFAAMRTLSARIAAALSKADRRDAATFRVNAAAFDAKLRQLEGQERAIRTSDHGDGVAITEPVPLYMLQASGLTNRTPEQFSEAVEEGNDVPTAVLQKTLDLFDQHRVRALVYNQQTSGAETRQILTQAQKDRVPTVPVTETLPDGKDYLSWMNDNLAALRRALSSGDSS